MVNRNDWLSTHLGWGIGTDRDSSDGSQQSTARSKGGDTSLSEQLRLLSPRKR